MYSSDVNAEIHCELLWGLLLRMEGNFNNLVQLELHSSGECHLPSILKRLACQSLKTLEIHNLSDWQQVPMSLEPEVCRSLLRYSI
jgi:hypothetical protein